MPKTTVEIHSRFLLLLLGRYFNKRIMQIDRRRFFVLQCITKGGEPLCFRLDYQVKMNVL